MKLHRRELLGSAALLLVGGGTGARAQWLPWRPEAGSPPAPFVKGPWIFFDPTEGAAVEALVDRLIPPDPDTPGGKDAGCGVFIDRQLAGPYGRRAGLYLSPRSSREQSSRARRTKTVRPAHIARRWRRSTSIANKEKGGAFASLSDADKDASLAVSRAAP